MPPAPLAVGAVIGTGDQAGAPGTRAPAPVAPGHRPRTARALLPPPRARQATGPRRAGGAGRTAGRPNSAGRAVTAGKCPAKSGAEKANVYPPVLCPAAPP